MKEERLYHSVAKKITDLIDKGSFPIGSRLPGERDLAERFGVSRVTVREAEISLQAIGRLKIKTGSGVYVVDPADNQESFNLDASAFELTEARLLFESEAAALAAPRITDTTLAHLDSLVLKMGSESAAEADSADYEFHLAIAQASGNPIVQHVVETLWKIRNETVAIREVYDSICSEDPAHRSGEHLEILEALRARDSSAAREAMRRHFGRILETMLDVTEAQELDAILKKSSESRERFLRIA